MPAGPVGAVSARFGAGCPGLLLHSGKKDGAGPVFLSREGCQAEAGESCGGAVLGEDPAPSAGCTG